MTRPIALVCMMILAASPALAADGAASETSIVEAWQNAPDAVFEARAIDLADLKWVARPLVVLADTPDDHRSSLKKSRLLSKSYRPNGSTV